MDAFRFQVLIQRRELKKWSRRDIIVALHDLGVEVHENTIANWEAGDTTPDADKLGALAKVLGCAIEDFFSPETKREAAHGE